MKKSPRKILFITGSLGVGGLERQLTEVIRNLPKAYQAYLITKNIEAYYLDQVKDRLHLCYSLNKSHFSILDIFPIYREITNIDPDIIYSWSRLTSHFCLLIKVLSRCKFRLINGSIRDAPIIKSFVQWVESVLYNFYDVVVANSYAGLKAYNQQGRSNRFVVYNGFDLTRLPRISKRAARENLSFPKDKFIVPMIGGLRDAKDHVCLIRAAKECSLIDKEILFYIVGEGVNKSRLENLVRELNLNNVVFLGNRSDVEYILLASDVSVLCSTNGEGISNSIIESLACGVPVVATDNGGTREILVNGVNGYIVKPGDFKDISAKLIYLKKNSSVLLELSKNTEEFISKFGIKIMMASFESILNRRRGPYYS